MNGSAARTGSQANSGTNRSRRHKIVTPAKDGFTEIRIGFPNRLGSGRICTSPHRLVHSWLHVTGVGQALGQEPEVAIQPHAADAELIVEPHQVGALAMLD